MGAEVLGRALLLWSRSYFVSKHTSPRYTRCSLAEGKHVVIVWLWECCHRLLLLRRAHRVRALTPPRSASLAAVCWCSIWSQPSQPRPEQLERQCSFAHLMTDCCAVDGCRGELSRHTQRCMGRKRQVPFTVCLTQTGAWVCGG